MSEPAYLEIGDVQLALAGGLILVNGAISVALRLRMERFLAVAAVRSVVQLLLVGLVLDWIFAIRTWWMVAALLAFMISAASLSAVNRASRTYAGIHLDSLVSMFAASVAVAAVAVTGILSVRPWYHPQYMIPFMGMLLGNALNGISLGLDRLLVRCGESRAAIEARLAHGATRWEAARPAIAEALRTGMTPIVNTMMVVGIVSLPGMMTGQILAGADPADAARYQILILFMIAATTALGTLGSVLLGYRRLFNARHQLRAERIRIRKG